MYLVLECRKQKVSLQIVTAKMAMLGIDMNKNGFQTCCQSLVSERMERLERRSHFLGNTITPKIFRVQTVSS